MISRPAELHCKCRPARWVERRPLIEGAARLHQDADVVT
ncbi:hypothetical protein SCH4B_2696 [Ruegeria sp. TrichCH4B]|nr:hypothetical protein SCH4B_2696 [Ruegeria sp. TrichCH4B]